MSAVLSQMCFGEEIYSRSIGTLVDVIAETRHELSNYLEIIIEISDRIQRSEAKKDVNDRIPDAQVNPRNKEAIARLRLGCLSKDAKQNACRGC